MRKHLPTGVSSLFVSVLLVGGAAMSCAADGPKYEPRKVTIGIKGLQDMEVQIALTGVLYGLDAVEAVDAQADKVTLQLKPEKTLALGDVVKAAEALSTGEVKLAVDVAGVSLVGTCELALMGLGGAKDEEVARVLGTAPNVDKVTGSGAKWVVTFKGSKGATVGEVSKALAAGLGARAGGGTPPAVGDVSWTGPKAPKVEGGHACGAGCGPGRR